MITAPNSAIPMGARRRATDIGQIAGAGVMLMAPTGEALFLKRTDGAWDFPGGGRDGDETPEQTALREMVEEIGAAPYGERKQLCAIPRKDGAQSIVYLQPVKFKFTPRLSDEHTEFQWLPADTPPTPLRPITAAAIEHVKDSKQAQDALAFDRASVRRIDQDGRLHVELTNISKANICPYKGSEIPGAEQLGLDQDKIYKLLRDPEELEKATATFNNIPLLSEHIAVSAQEPQKEKVVGSTGTDAVFVAPYLRNSLVIWDAEAIRGVQDQSQQEISCAYRYVPDMTPGVYEGEPYDGVMREIRGNHVALVATGRAGPDVIVGDSAVTTRKEKRKMNLSKKAVLAKGALLAYCAAIGLAQDAMPDLDTILTGVKKSNFKTEKPRILAALKLAKDEDVKGASELLDKMDDVEPEHKEAEDVGGAEAVLEMLRGKISDEDLATVEAKLKELFPDAGGGGEADDADEVEQLVAELRGMLEKMKGGAGATGGAEDDPKHIEGMPETKVDQKAMDAALRKLAEDSAGAIAKAVKEAETKTVARMQAIAQAEEAVKPYVGKIAIACDSAEAVYKAALEAMNVKIEGVHPSAYKAVLEAQPRPGSHVTLATDHGTRTDDFEKRYPDANRLAIA